MFAFFRKTPVSPPPTDTLFNISTPDGHELVDSLTCVICFDIMTEPVVLGCGHCTCASCWNDWKETEPNVTCPTCRAPNPPGMPLQSEILRVLARSLVLTQPCGARVNIGARHAHESVCPTCIAVPMIRERVFDADAHAVPRLLRTQTQWEKEQIRKLQKRGGREWETGERDSRYRRFAAMRVRQAIAAMRGNYVPATIIAWARTNRNVRGRIEVPLYVRVWLDETEIRIR